MPDFDPPLQRCDLCHSQNIILHQQDYHGITIYQCNHCMVQFMNPQYSDQHLHELYQDYQTHARKGHTEAIKKHSHELNLKDIEAFIPPGNFLSVGCGNGYDLMEARKRGWKVEGYEVDPDFSGQLSQQLQVPVQSGSFPELPYPEQHFDCIYMNHVVEHLKSPASYLRKCHQLLKKEGILYIACPNIASFSNRGKKILEKMKIKGLAANYYDTWHHLFYFAPVVMKSLLEKYFGFQVLLIGNDRKLSSKQSALGRAVVNTLAYRLPYKAGFRLIARKAEQE